MLLVTLLACVTTTPSKSDDDVRGLDDCDVTATSVPADGAEDVFYRDPVVFTLSSADPDATVTSDVPGQASPSPDGLTITWTPDAPLAPSTSFSVTLRTCAGDTVVRFSTSAIGTPVPDDVLMGTAFAIDLLRARIVAPAGLGPVITQFWREDLLLGVDAVAAGRLDLTGAIGVDDADPVQQNYCNPTIDLTATYAEAPTFQVGPVDTVLPFDRGDALVRDFVVSGTFSPDGRSFARGTFGGTVDTRPLSWILAASEDPAFICDLAAASGVACEPCEDDGAPYCLTLLAEDVTAMAISTGPIVPIDIRACRGCRSWTAETVPPADEQVCPPG